MLWTTNGESTRDAVGRAVIAEPQAQGIGGVEEQLLRCIGKDDLRIGDIQGDVPFTGQLLQQGTGQHLII